MQITSWRGFTFADDNYWIGVRSPDAYGNWSIDPIVQQRPNANAEIVGVTRGPRVIAGQWGYGGVSLTVEQAWDAFMAEVKPLLSQEGTLVMTRNDATEWQCRAMLTSVGRTVADGVNVYNVTWLTTDPLWHAETPETALTALVPPTIPNSTFLTDTTGWTKGSDPANVTSAFSRDAGVFSDAAGSGKLVVSANTGAGGTVYVMNDTKFTCAAGEIVAVTCDVRTTNGQELDGNGVDAWPYLAFYDVTDVLLGTGSGNWIGGQGDNIWAYGYYEQGTAPANTSYCKIGAKVLIGAGDTGTAYFDAFKFVSSPSGTATPFDVEGSAPTNLILTVTPAGNFPQSIKAREFTITNNGTSLVENKPYMVWLGNNTASTINGTYWALLCEGRVQPCQISDYDSEAAFMWMVIDWLAPGQSLTYTLLVSDQTIMPSTTFTALDRPIIDTGYQYGTASGGGHTTTVTNSSGITGDTNRWDEGLIRGLTGTNAGLDRRISASTATSITHAAFPNAFANTDKFLIVASHNGMLSTADWIYAIRPTSRPSDEFRGLWRLDEWASKKPGDYGYDGPGSWAPHRYWNNNDVFGQAPFYKSGNDYFAGLDADRRWENGGDLDYRGYDGVALTMPCDITALKFTLSLKNPNGMCTAILGSRKQGGAAEFVHDHENATATTTLTTQSEQTINFSTGTRSIYLGLVPTTGSEIGESWAGAEGTASGTTATTLTDSSAEWITNQFAGGKITIVTGTNQSATITANTTTAITVASWPSGTPSSTASYVITNKPYVSTVRLVEEFRMTWDPTPIAISAVSAETDAYVLFRDILIDANTSGDPYTRVSIDPSNSNHYIVLMSGESLVVDGELMRAYVADSTTGDELRTVPPKALDVFTVASDATQRASTSWLEVYPGSHTVTLDADEVGVGCDIDVAWVEAVHG